MAGFRGRRQQIRDREVFILLSPNFTIGGGPSEEFDKTFLSIVEDVFVVGLGFLALKYPVVALVVAVTLLVLIVLFAAVIIRKVRSWFRRRLPA